jgi:hypothetical protein
MPTTDHDPIDFTFADDGDLVRRTPKAVPEDPVEKRLQREREASEWLSKALGLHVDEQGRATCDLERVGAIGSCIEVKHGSGKVKV